MMAVRVRPEAGTLAGSSAAVKSMIAFDRLLVLDDLWTGLLRSPAADDRTAIETNLGELGDLVDDMQSALLDVIEHASELRVILNSFEEKGIDIDSLMAELLHLRPDVSDAYRELFSVDITDVGLRGAAIFACDYLAEEGEAEGSNLREKYNNLKGGGPPDPDLRPCFRCALLLAKLGGGAAAAISLLIASHGTLALLTAVPGVTNPAADVVLRWKESGCAKCWDTITRGRFS
jgi:hypothetical protein